MTSRAVGLAAPKIRGQVRPRPPEPLRRARSILIGVVTLVLIAEALILIAIVFFRLSPGRILPAIIVPLVVAAVSWLASRGFRDRSTLSLVLASTVALFLDAAGIGIFAYIASGASTLGGNANFAISVLAFLLLALGLPLTSNLARGARWFLQKPSRASVATAATLAAETDTALVIHAGGAAAPAAKAAAQLEPLVSVRGLKKHFPIVGGLLRRQIATVYAVDGADFDIQPGEIFSLVGESGCGKTTLGRTLLQLTPPTAGKVIFDGYELTDVDPDDMRPLRRRMQIIFQDPFGSLNPRMPVSDIIGEGLLAQGVTNRKERDKRVEDSLEIVGLRRDYTRRYPHEFSGGQRQRIGIARALALGPDFIVCDEPVSALDVSIQSQVLNLLRDLRRDFNLTYLFISHNLSVVQYFSDRVAVMYLGRIVEVGTVEQLYRDPRHPYTVALLSAIPVPDPRRRRKRLVLKGDVPSPAAPPSGCRFHTRCWLREQLGNPERCVVEDPALRPLSPGHTAACHFAEEISQQSVAQVAEHQSAVETAVADPV
ncbi:MAG TPA: oligopeptide/dipeptide ABC transporter ATP-binding protein [Candidatus Limnocylindrales bacterium]|jgi:oligopeptide/dipeptide ABC transporter ATP-binding protein|nr:oligopeptide/dipeptide ABC transporter ATP-binding protein [Candidatus Limnocylindrales bacterium]